MPPFWALPIILFSLHCCWCNQCNLIVLYSTNSQGLKVLYIEVKTPRYYRDNPNYQMIRHERRQSGIFASSVCLGFLTGTG